MLKSIILALSLIHTPYTRMNCWLFVDHATQMHCGRGLLDSTCNGQLEIVHRNLRLLDLVTIERELKQGDIAQFHTGHVAMYLGQGEWIDSTVKRNGVAIYQMQDELAANQSGWYAGPIRVLRKKSTKVL